MAKRQSYEIKKQILRVLKEGPLKYSEIERKIDTNFNTIRNNCEELEDHDYISVKTIEKDPANGKPSHPVSITSKGRDFLKKLEKKESE